MKKLFLILLSAVFALGIFCITGRENITAKAQNIKYKIIVESDSEDVFSEKFTIVYDQKASKNYHSGSFENGSILKYTFIGTGIEIYGFTGSICGAFSVSIDGQKVKDIDCSKDKDEYKSLLGSVTGLADDEHTLEIKTTEDDAWVAVDYFSVSVGKEIYNNSRNLALCGDIVTSVPYPTGGGCKDLNVIRNEELDEIVKNQGAVGGYNSESAQSYDSYNGGGENRFYMGYVYPEEMYFAKFVFVEGATYHDGGWFKKAPVVEVRIKNQWQEVSYIKQPSYPEDDKAEGHGYGIFVYTFESVRATGIRIIGDAGGAGHFVSVAQIEVYGNADTKAFAEGASYKNPVNYTVHEHVWEKKSETPATCTADAIEHMVCSVCLAQTDKIADNTALGHDLTKHDEKPATCTEKGWNEYQTCSRCNYSTYKEIAVLGHEEVIDQAVPATCTEKGKSEGKHCSVCNIILVEQTEISALGHEYEDEFECHDRQCVRCDFVNKATKEHSYDDGRITKQPTVKEEGEKQFTCSVCGQTKTEPIAKLEESTQSCGNCEKAELNGNIFDEMMCLAALLACVMLALRLRKR